MSRSVLSHDDRQLFIEELNRLPSWSLGGVLGERSVLLGAGLPEFWVSSYPLTGTPRIDGGILVASLEGLRHLESRPTYHALGALADYLLWNTPHLEGKLFLAYLIQRYQFVTDPQYMNDLQRSFPLPHLPKAGEGLDWDIEQPAFEWKGPTALDTIEGIWSTDTPFLDAVFLEKGAKLARAVCRIEDDQANAIGTGFLIGPDLIMTNHHVVSADSEVQHMKARFGYRVDISGQLQSGETYDILEVVCRSPELELDYTVLRVKDAPGAKPEIGYSVPNAGILKVGDAAYIVQHPAGEPQKVVLQRNKITYIASDQRRVQYLTNTRRGSSGSPVCNQRWEVVALHHSGAPLPQLPGISYVEGNEGIPMIAILQDIEIQCKKKLSQ